MQGMNQQTLAPGELHVLRKQIEQLETRMTMAHSRVHALGRQVRISRGFSGLGTVFLLLVIALTSIAAAPQRRSDEPLSGPTTYEAPFEILDGQEDLILKVGTDSSLGFNSLKLYPTGASDSSPATLIAGIAEKGHVFFKAAMWWNQNVNATIGVEGGTNAGLVLRYGGSFPTRLAMDVVNGKPVLNLSDFAGKVLVELGQGDYGGSRLMLTNGAGGTIMQAGTTENGVGEVAVWPQGPGGFLPTAPIAGGAFALKEQNRLPGTFICGVGCAGH
jgi:hypothetical protein